MVIPPDTAWSKTDADPPAVYYEDALDRFQRNDFEGAIIQLKNALRQNPSNLAARILLGRASLAIGNARSAIKELTIARREGADEAFTVVPLAKAYSLLDEHQRVLNEFRQGNRDPEIEADIRLVRARAHLALDKLDQAQRGFADVARFRPDSIEPLLGMARVQMARGDAAAVEELVGAAFFRTKTDARVWFASGDLKRFKQDLAGAVTDFGKAVQLDPRHIQARMARAGTLIDLGRHQEAKADVEYVRAKVPGNPRATYFHALILVQAGELTKAKAALDEAAKILGNADPATLKKSPPALLLAGVVAYFRQDFESAHTHLSRYVKLVPRHATARRILGSLLLRRGDAERAIAVLEPAVQSAPKNVRLVAMLGTAYMRARRHSDAAEMFQRAAVLVPKNAALQRSLGLSRLSSGQDESATKALRTALALDSSETQAAVLLSLTNLRRGEFKKALETAQILIKQDPRNAFAHNMVAGAQLGLGDFSGARASFEKALEADPTYMSARFNLAKLDVRSGKVSEGEARYRKILDENPKNARAMVALAKIAERKNDYEEAIRWLEKARFADPKLVAEQVHLAELLIVQKNTDDALKVARALSRNFPKNLPALEVLGRAEVSSGAPGNARKTFRRLANFARIAGSADWLVRTAQRQIRIDDSEGAETSLQAALHLEPKHLPAQAAMFKLEVKLGRLDAAQRRVSDLRYGRSDSVLGDTLAGDLAMQRGRYDDAADAYAWALKNQPNTILLIRLYRARRAAGKTRQMIKPLEDWVRERPRDGAAQKLLASAYMENDRLAESLTLHEALLKTAPNDPAILNNLALLYQKNNDPRALPVAQKAYRRAPTQAGIVDTYGWLLVQSGEAVKGLALLRDARARATKVPEIRYHIAVALVQLGRHEEARRELDETLSSGKNFEGAAEARALQRKLSGG